MDDTKLFGYDLHTHTTASDGTLSPADLVRYAREAGLAGVGITDHDTMGGVKAAEEEGEKLGIQVIPGIEISTECEGREVHILGYYCSAESPSLAGLLEELRAARRRRLERIVENLRRAGLDISLDRIVIAIGNEAVGRPHIARALVKLGFAPSVQKAFEKYLVRGRPGYVPRYKIDPLVAVRCIREAGGVPVLAHPGLVGNDSIIPPLVEAGLMGLEVWYPEHTAEQITCYKGMAESLGLVTTGGSDFHGKGEREAEIGAVRVPERTVARLAEAAQRMNRPCHE